MKPSSPQPVFGKRKEVHTIIIARGDSIRHFTLRPWMAACATLMVGAITVGYLAATTYLVLRDDLISASVARQARMQQAYEDRISSLRAQVDRITSRQLLDQQVMETKVSELLKRQSQLSLRHGRLGPILDKVSTEPEPELPLKPAQKAEVTSKSPAVAIAALWQTRTAELKESSADKADRIFLQVTRSLRDIEAEQMDKIESLAANAYETADKIREVLADAGLTPDQQFGGKDLGGPLVAISAGDTFELKVRELDEALKELDTIKGQARKLPIANPAPGQSVSSGFGVRRDPIIGAPAMHSGLDFRAKSGSPILATAAGKVVSAGWNGGYGKMVEIDHGHGITTRFAHMSRVAVSVGDRVEVGDQLGQVGSTGRSTGPHLHYEVRKNGHALNPVQFIKAGKKIAQYL